MSDDLKNAAIGVFGLMLFTGFVHYRAERAIERDISRTSPGGSFRAQVNGRGLLGLAFGQADTVFVAGKGFKSDGFPFQIRRGDGIRAYVRTLNLDFTDFRLRDIPVRRFTAAIPGAIIDAGRAFFDDRIVMRAAKDGTAEAVVGAEGLAALFVRKYPQYKNVQFTIRPGFVDLSVDVPSFSAPLKMESTSKVGLEGGRYIVLTESTMRLNGKEATADFVKTQLKNVNPVVDLHRDLGLGGYFIAQELVVGEGTLTIRGTATVPKADESSNKQEKKP